MTYKSISKIICFLLLLAAVSCRKDSDTFTSSEVVPDPIVRQEVDFDGLVSDDSGQAIDGATIWINNNFVESDENGYFTIQGEGNINGTYLKIQKEGYFDGYGVLTPSTNGQSHVEFELIRKEITATFSTSENQTIRLTGNNNFITLSKDSYQYEDGTSYSGAVHMYTSYIDPTTENFSSIMPGDLVAITADQEMRELRSFGMMHVELYDDQQRPLQINEPALISIDIPSDLIADAPAEIPLWYFDTDTGFWIEEGYAIKNGNHYEGEVNHFTLWNCDVPFPYINYTGTITTTDNLVSTYTSNLKIKMTWIENDESACTYADNQGVFSGKVPANARLTLEIIDGCGTVVLNKEIGPFISDVTETHNINVNQDITTVSGRIVNCDGTAVNNGYVILSNGTNQTIIPVNNRGTFERSFNTCNSTSYTIQAIDLDNLLQGEETVFEIDNSMLNIGDVAACDAEIQSAVCFNWNNTDYALACIVRYSMGEIPQDTMDVPQLDVWEFEFLDNYSNGNTLYTYTFINWDPSMTDPEEQIWGYSFETEDFIETGDVPERAFIFDGALEIVATGKESGEYVEFAFNDGTVLEWITGTISEEVTIRFKGILQ